MIYALLAVVVLQATCQGLLVYWLVQRGDRERQKVEMKLLAICNPPAAVHVESIERGPTGSVTYMDDEAMVNREKATR